MPKHARSPIRRLLGSIVGIVAGVSVVGAAQGPAASVRSALQPVGLRDGRILGFVRDSQGHAVGGALVSALGNAASSRAALSDAAGRFTLPLPAGQYVLRTHRDGYDAARDLVIVSASSAIQRNITLVRQARLMASTAGADARVPASVADDLDHPHDETAWRLRHLTRSVLHDEGVSGAGTPTSASAGDFKPPVSLFDRTLGTPARLATAFFTETDFTGQVDMLTASDVGPGGTGGSQNAARMSLGAPVGEIGDWVVRTAMTTSDASSWAALGEYSAKGDLRHAFTLGLGYGSQAEWNADAGQTATPVSMGAVYGADRWHLSPDVEIDYGARLDHYAFGASTAVVGAHGGGRVQVLPQTFLFVSGAKMSEAPGAESFLPESSGPWLAPEKTFQSVDPASVAIEYIRSVQLGLEREIGGRAVAVRRFHEEAANQSATVFGFDAQGNDGPAGRYLAATVGGVDLDGWAVRVSGALAPRVTGTVEYAAADARWSPGASAIALATIAPSVLRGGERLNDLSTRLEATLPETATRVLFVYRLNSKFGQPGGVSPAGPAGRFDLEISQTLPAELRPGANWEVLLAVRNLLRSTTESGSMYDELLTVAPPTRVLAGLRVRF